MFLFRNLIQLNFSRRHYSNAIVYVSKCANPYQNLAFENWLYENCDFSDQNSLFIWRNEPTVVIGKHQNPWAECNPEYLSKNNINLARRFSGGGAVYHDLGNINFTFFTSKTKYDRKKNLNLIVEALVSKWKNLHLDINERDDIIMDGEYKISGTAAKIGRKTAYHHCTLLFRSNVDSIPQILQPALPGIESKATASLRSPVKSLSNVYQDINFDDICSAVTQYYLDFYKAGYRNVKIADVTNDSLYPGTNHQAKTLQTWDWLCGRTPNFSIVREFVHHQHGILKFIFHIRHGRIADVSLKQYNRVLHNTTIVHVMKKLSGTHLHSIDVSKVQDSIDVPMNDFDNFLYRSCFAALLIQI